MKIVKWKEKKENILGSFRGTGMAGMVGAPRICLSSIKCFSS